jgi:nucleoside-diphosphate-sugar epimerase
MMRIAIWGAGSGLGAAMVDYFCQHNIDVIAIAREPSKNPKLSNNKITTISCDAIEKSQVQAAVLALPENTLNISTMGSFGADIPVDYIGHRYLIDALEKSTLQHLLLVTSLGCGDSWQYLSERAKMGFGGAVREKTLAEAWLQSSNLQYTILRPGGLKDGAVTHKGELSQNIEIHGAIHRAEVARLSHELLLRPDCYGKVFQCIDPTVAPY